MAIGLEQPPAYDTPHLVDAVAEYEAAILDRDRRRRTREELAVQVAEHDWATRVGCVEGNFDPTFSAMKNRRLSPTSLVSVFVASALVTGASIAQAPAGPDATIRARLDSLDAQSSFYAKQLSSGKEIAIRADEPMNTAS